MAAIVLHIPLWASQAWRLVNWTFMLGLSTFWVAMIASVIRGEHRVPGFTAWGQAALLVFALRAAVGQAEHWSAPVTLEGSPGLTLGLLLALGNVVALHRAGQHR